MKKICSMKRAAALSVCLISCSFAGVALGAPGTLTKKQGGARVEGDIGWRASSREYSVVMKNGGNISVPLAQVAEVSVDKPAAFDDVVSKVSAGQNNEAIPFLEKIVSDYEMLEWDIKACSLLCTVYEALGKAEKVVSSYENVMNRAPNRSAPFGMIHTYCNALLKLGRHPALAKVLDEIVATGSRDGMAVALVLRGDMLAAAGKKTEALVDGYLRTVLLFEDIKAVQPEALYKAVQCFQDIRDHANADRYRKKLIEKYPNSEYSKKVLKP